jgi:hypothetical protein
MTADKYRDLGGPTSPTTIVLAELPAIGQLACAGGDHDAVGQAMRYRCAEFRATAEVQPNNPANILGALVVIAQLAEALDRGTLELALRIVPVEWWHARLGTSD